MKYLTIEQTMEMADFFQIELKRDGYYHTSWGTKTIEGLRESIERIINNDNISDSQMVELGYKKV